MGQLNCIQAFGGKPEKINLLMIGTGQSGKTTIFKQMKILHLKGYGHEERMQFKWVIFCNILDSMHKLVNVMFDLNIPFEISGHREIAQNLHQQYTPSSSLSDVEVEESFLRLADDLQSLWRDDGVQKAYYLRSQYSIQESVGYFFDKLNIISKDDYIPSEIDILNCRQRTSGLHELDFVVKRQPFRIIDVGGQRAERRTWIHAFDKVTALLFVISLNEYDELSPEDKSTNRMYESLQLFKEISNLKLFSKTPIIIFFNKEDLFDQKIQRVDLNVCFRDYKGGKNKQAALSYIEETFINVLQNKDRPQYTYVTTATNTDSISTVFNATRGILLEEAIARANNFI